MSDNKKFKINDSYESPEKFDYNIFGLHKKRTIVKGELILCEYFTNYDGTNYSDLVLTEARQFIRNPANYLVIKRVMTITWYLKDDSVGTVIVNEKYYSAQESIEEGIDMRTNIISYAKLYIMGTIGLANGKDFMDTIISSINLYIQGSTQQLKDVVNASDKSYLTPTIKATVISILTYP